MTAQVDSTCVSPFVRRVLERDGAAVEALGPGDLFVVLPGGLREALDLPGAATLALTGESHRGTVPFPLEGVGMQWLIDRARARGRRAAARLAAPLQNPRGRLEKARARLVLPNAKIAHAEAMRPVEARTVLEFRYEARCEDRTDGRLHVAVTDSGSVSFELADRLLENLGGAVPEDPVLDDAEVARRAASASSAVEAQVRKRLDPFCNASRRRMEAERERIVAYHDRLAHEAGRRRGRAQLDAETLASKREAILRQRSERLEDLAERHAVAAAWWPASALVLHYEVTVCRFRALRRRREVQVDVEWDPFLGDFLGPPCDACRTPTFHLHVCDAAGHVTCAACAARCATCGRVTCRACRTEGCGCGNGPR